VRFTFDGRAYSGYAGDTLASALLAAGATMVARSSKYHRPRGILGAGVEEPNALVQLFEGARTVPNVRMTEATLVEGLVARSIHASPSIEFDLRAVNNWFARLIPAGFYYKTFMASQAAWHFFERHIRAASGLGHSPEVSDPDCYDKRFAHADVLVVGAGLAGLSAARAAARAGARVILCDEQASPGWLLSSDEPVEGLPAARVGRGHGARARRDARREGAGAHHRLRLPRPRLRHPPGASRRPPASRAAACGARAAVEGARARRWCWPPARTQRPLVFARNDLPGVMLASAVSTYVRRYAVLPGRQAVVFTNHDGAYDAALALHAAGAQVQVVDARAQPDGSLSERARAAGIPVLAGHVVTEAQGSRAVTAAVVQAVDAQGRLSGAPRTLACELLAVSGGFSAVIDLHSQAGSKAVWNEELATFLPGAPAQSERSAGACAGARKLADGGRRRRGRRCRRGAGLRPGGATPVRRLRWRPPPPARCSRCGSCRTRCRRHVPRSSSWTSRTT
jgi:sarcosine oxidase subunit alpha